MRNIFDQYDQPENKLTHALLSTLCNDKKLERRFLTWLKVKNIPPLKSIHIIEQGLPDYVSETEEEVNEGLPDGCLYDDVGWMLLIESKVKSSVSVPQLCRHSETAAKNKKYKNAQIIVFTVDPCKKLLPTNTKLKLWKEVYSWFCQQASRSKWAYRFTNYMEVFESKMIKKDYQIRGTITMFNGFHFSENNPYIYREGKRIIRLLTEKLKNDKRLRQLGFNPKCEGRKAITEGDDGTVWDFISLKKADGAVLTAFPHVTLSANPSHAGIAITIPNGIRGGIKTKLRDLGIERFSNLLSRVEKNLRPIIKKIPDAKPMFYIDQRRYKSQRSLPVRDGHIEVDLRTIIDTHGTGLSYQPGWIEAIHGLLVNKKSNIQSGVKIYLPYSEKIMQSEKAVKIMIEALIGLKPFLQFALQK